MTELEKELLEAVRKIGPNGAPIHYTEAAAKVARKYAREIAEKAWDNGAKISWLLYDNVPSRDERLSTSKTEFLKENGLTE